MSGFYQVEQNLPNFRVANPLFVLQGDVRELRLQTQYNGGIFELEPTKAILTYNAAYRSNAVFSVVNTYNTGTTAQLADALQALNTTVTTNISSIDALSTLYSLRDVFITTLKNNAIFAINSALLTGKITNVVATAAVLNGLRQTPVTVSPAFQSLLDNIEDIFVAVENRDTAAAEAARTAFLFNQTARFTTVISELSTVYQGIAGVGFTQFTVYFLTLLGAFNSATPNNSGDTQALVDLSKQKL